jgi:antitoxin VapB
MSLADIVYYKRIYTNTNTTTQKMPLHIRDERAARLAKQLAVRKGVTMTQAVVGALESALAREARPLRVRIAEIAREAQRLGDPAHGRPVGKEEIDDLWGHE